MQLFHEHGLPQVAAEQLVDPNGDFDYADLVSFVQVVTFEDLRAVGLKVAAARLLLASLRPGGEVYNRLVVGGRLKPTKPEPPKQGVSADDGNPNDGSSISDLKSSSSGSTKLTSVQVPRRIRDRIEAVSPQIYEQDRLSDACSQSFSTLSEARRVAFETGVIDEAGYQHLGSVNQRGNSAKHDHFGQ